MQRRLAVVHQRLGHRRRSPALVVDQDDQLRRRAIVPDRRHRLRDAGTPARGLPRAHDWLGPLRAVLTSRGQLPAGRPDLRRPGRRAGRRRARRPAARLPAGLRRLGPGAPGAAPGAGCAPSPPTSAATPPWPGPRGRGRLPAARDRPPTSSRCSTPPGWRARTSSGTTGAAIVAWALAAWHPDRVRTLTALSVPHPAAMAQAMVTSDQALRSYYMARVPAAVPARAAAAGRRRRGRCAGCCAAAGCPTRPSTHYVARMREPGALARAARLVPRAAAERPRPGGHRARADAARVEHRRRLPRPRGHRGHRAVRRRPYRLEVLEGVSHWIPELAADRVAELVTAHVTTA